MESESDPAGKQPPPQPPQVQPPLQESQIPPQLPPPENSSAETDSLSIADEPTPAIHRPEEPPTQQQRQQQEQRQQNHHQKQQQRQQHSGATKTTNSYGRQKSHSGGTGSHVDPSDRVFPIRSVISVDQSQPTPWVHSRGPVEPDYFPRLDSTWDGRRCPSTSPIVTSALGSSSSHPSPALPPSSPRDRASTGTPRPSRKNTVVSSSSDDAGNALSNYERPAVAELPIFSDLTADPDETPDARDASASTNTPGSRSSSSSSGTPKELVEDVGFITSRFQHVMTDHGHAIITGPGGPLQRCEDEPIHTPGAVQAFGLLIALREEPGGLFSVRIVSENSKEIIGFAPHELFGLGSFTDILSEEQVDNLLDHIDFIRDEESDPATGGPDIFSISLRPPKSRKAIKLWCAIHINQSHPDLIICEFELVDDELHPTRPPDEMAPEEPEDTLYQNPTAEQIHQSTEVGSKPLRVLRGARNRRSEAGAMQVFDIMSQVQEQFASAPDLERFLKTLVGIVKELTGFHRVMVYQFDAAFNGKVVTELVDPAQTRDLYYGLHFPASDIPKQARELYKLNKVRLLYDRELESAKLVCRTMEDLENPLDLSHAYLRAISPIHLKYLANMAVRSSMSISLDAFGELWGLISCQGYGPRGMRVSFPIRKMCRMVGETASRNIERLSYASRLQARKLINTMPTDKNPSGYIIASSEDLLKLFDADFGMLSIGDETKVLGKITQSQEALALLEYLRLQNFTTVLTTHDISQDFPNLRYTPGFSVIAGLLYVPLSVGGHDFIAFFRKGQVREVEWAGNPYEKTIRQGTSDYLEPRSSFQAWRETVLGKCREWSEEQVETAAVLCLIYGKFIEVWRQKEAALQSSRLTRLLLANSAHEVRTPLNAIINYLEIALEGSIDQETRDNLAKSHSASKSLIYVINDLLDLTKTEEGRELVKDEIMDLPACMSEATEPFKTDAKRKGISYEVVEHPGLPKHVYGDYRRVRQAVANVTANAVQNTASGSVKVECFVVEVLESRVRVEIAIHDTGRGMSNEQLDNIFQDLEQVSSADPGEPEVIDESLRQGHEGRTLGLGLAVVARIVRNMDGQLRLKSEEGKGSRFVIQLPFELPSSDMLQKLIDHDTTADVASDVATSVSVTKTMPPTQAGEVLLVDRGNGNAVNTSDRTVAKTRSFDETNSVNSLKSSGSGARSNKSNAERLIDAIQTSFDPSATDKETTNTQRGDSMGRRSFLNSSTSSLPSIGASRGDAAQELPYPPTMNHAQPAEGLPGVYPVRGSSMPIKPVKMPDTYSDSPTGPRNDRSSRILFEIAPDTAQVEDETKPSESLNTRHDKLRVLIAEDDPINMKILTKRLEKAGHKVYPTVNGEDCATVYKEKAMDFDIILMDMQMPIVDGLTSTKLIRSFEISNDFPPLSAIGHLHGRIPIFAVSASLVEKDRAIYIEAGFDGWILKPIDFKRLHVLLDGITNDNVREQCLYKPSEWECGGWFAPRAT